MSGLARRREATYEDLLALPDDVLGQLVEGELHATPRPAIDHQRASSVLGIRLGDPFDLGGGGPGGWWIVDEPELHLDWNVLVPDLAGWRRERLPELPREAFFTLAPDWVCEVLSPSTARLDRVKKLSIYAREGVGHAWLVDPVLETLEVFRRQGEAWLLVLTAGGDDIVRAEPFDAIELTLTGLWIRPA
ncbi:MAG: Uma2 family endonuclease [Holophagales bacterium]|nr:Uma2 family endonuclease [Holophagales bacterium]MBK9967107.1 Uma2 family endonuclease [Holophagales bacterium]